jgi:F-type H+-transporting ATPase subunit c
MEPTLSPALMVIGATLSAAIVTFAAAFGISSIGKSAMEGIARQPDAAANIQTAMIIACALIEGVALFSAVICFLGVGK